MLMLLGFIVLPAVPLQDSSEVIVDPFLALVPYFGRPAALSTLARALKACSGSGQSYDQAYLDLE